MGRLLFGAWFAAHLGHGLLPSPLGALLVMLVAMALCAGLGLIIEQAAYRPLRTRAWIAPAIFLGAAAGYVADQVVQDSGAAPAVALAPGPLSGRGWRCSCGRHSFAGPSERGRA